MEYQGFVVDAFERDPGKWRAKLSLSSGRPLITGRKKIWRFVTSIDATTASAALLIALAAIERERSRARLRYPRNSGVVMASARIRRHAPFLKRTEALDIVLSERESDEPTQPSNQKNSPELACLMQTVCAYAPFAISRWHLKLARMVRRISPNASLNGQPNY
jgi:hypothetical protein